MVLYLREREREENEALGVRTEERIVSTVVQGLGLYI